MALTAALSVWDLAGPSYSSRDRGVALAQALSVAAAYLYPRDITHSVGTDPLPDVPESSLKARRMHRHSDLHHRSLHPEMPEIRDAFRVVLREGKADELYSDFIDAVEDRFDLIVRDAHAILSRLDGVPPTEDDSEANDDAHAELRDQVMVGLLDRLNKWQRTWATPLKALNEQVAVYDLQWSADRSSRRITAFTVFFHQLLHASLPPAFPLHLEAFLSSSLANLSRAPGPSIGPSHRRPIAPSPHLSRLGILPRYSSTLHRVAQAEIVRIALEETAKGWDTRYLAKAHRRVGEGIAGWLNALFEGNDAAQSALRSMFGRMDYSMCKCFFDIRTDELFDIIIDFPDSMSALEDLKDCLIKVDQRQVLVDKLNAANRKRLLHPGAETKDVITQYISTIRCLRILDPPGVLLHKVAEPIRKHLRDRPDTIKCIVAFLVEGEELHDEGEMGRGIISQTGEDEAENFSDPKWDPEPMDAAPEFRSGKASDIVSTLVSIYESREVIIKELQALLAARLLVVKDYDAVREIRTIELLKLRFGETALQGCDVMLKDMADSKRIDDHVHGDIESFAHPLIISRMFWPNVQSSALHLTPKLAESAERYEAAYNHFKPDKHLRWLQHLGTVTLSLELSERTVDVECSTLQACVIELFEGKDRWTLDELGDALGLGDGDAGALREALAFWDGLRVVREHEGLWGLVEQVEG